MPSPDPSPLPLPPLVALVGPTAVGKTELSLQLAERLGARRGGVQPRGVEIVSADSRLFYRGMDIGTAKPTPAEQARAPHHLIDVVDPDDVWSLTVFQQAAREVIADIHGRGGLPLLVGGTGQYVWGVLDAWDIPRVAPNPGLRAALEAWAESVTPLGLHQRLAVLDPQAAASIDYRNLRRTIRALEVIFTTGRPFSAQKSRRPSAYRTLVLGLARPRPELYERIDARIDAMLAAGLLEEVRSLLARGYSPGLPAFSAIGYAQMAAVLEGRLSIEEAVVEMKRLTRQFVRRQANWFKPDDPRIRWFPASLHAVDQMETAIRTWLD